jgi:hypothetical protein
MHWATTTFAVSSSTLSRIYDSYKSTSSALTDKYGSANLTIACSIQSVPAAAPASNPNILGFTSFSSPEKRLINIGIAFQYEDPSATEGLEQAIKRFAIDIDQVAKEYGVSDQHLYLNYAGSWQDVFSGYGKDSLGKMRRVAEKYDSKRVFQNQARGGFKLYR